MGKTMGTSQPWRFSYSGMNRPAVQVHRFRCPRQVRAQGSDDKGGSMNIVDANMSILRERIEEVRMQERLQQCRRRGAGWNYSSSYNSNLRRRERLHQSIKIAGLVAGSLGFTFLCGTLSIGLFSIMVHLVH